MAAPDPFSGALGKRFDRLKPLGRGGMAEVYLCMDRFHQRQVALKIVRNIGLGDEEEQQRVDKMWLNEMRLAGRLKHPYILEVYEAGTEGDHSFLVMEYLEGGTLNSYAAPDSLLPPPLVADIVFK